MLIQSLVIIAAMVVLSGAILTSTLVTAKASLHQTLLAKTQTAMNDATAAFVAAAALNVRKYGTEQPWPASTPTSEALCNSASAGASPCPLLAVATWHVTGRSTAGTAANSAPAPNALTIVSAVATPSSASDAQNLAATIDEQRVSATIAVRVTDATGRTLLADRSRQITARIFNAVPYVVITAARDSGSASGSIRASEGDSGGTPPVELLNESVGINFPITRHPAAFTDTRVRTSVDCSNSASNFNQSNPTAAVDTGTLVNHSIRAYGNQDWAYEAPCGPTYSVDNSLAPSDFATPIGSVYISNPMIDNVWQKRNENISTFAR